MMESEDDLIATSIADLYLLMSTIPIERRQYRGIARDVDAFVHQRCRVWVSFHHGVLFPIVNTELRKATLFMANNMREARFFLCGSPIFVRSIRSDRTYASLCVEGADGCVHNCCRDSIRYTTFERCSRSEGSVSQRGGEFLVPQVWVPLSVLGLLIVLGRQAECTGRITANDTVGRWLVQERCYTQSCELSALPVVHAVL